MTILTDWLSRRSAETKVAPAGFGVDLLSDLRVLDEQNSVKTVFDVGANEGYMTEQYCDVFPRAEIYSFEPFGEPFEKLEQGIGQRPNVIPVKAALGEEIGEETLNLNAENVTNSLLPNAPEIGLHAPEEWTRNVGSIIVEQVRMDAFCKEHNINHVDLLKIDTQGYEDRVLRGAGEMLTPATIRMLLVEVCFVDLYEGQASFADLFTLVTARGYRPVGFYDARRDDKHRIRWCDVLFAG
jgi:FkbM family methyltransferase